MIGIWELELNNAIASRNPSIITSSRGRIINRIRKEIKKLKDINSEDKQLIPLEDFLEKTIDDHKNQLSNRYNKEFLDKEATIPSIVTVLPKSVALSIKKIGACIKELKEAKTSKERFFGTIEVFKALGIMVATPGIFTAKFVARHWYLLLLLLPHLQKLIKFQNKEKEFNGDTLPQEQEEMAIETEMKALRKLYKPITSLVPETERDYNPIPKQWDRQYIKQGEVAIESATPLEVTKVEPATITNNDVEKQLDIQYIKQGENVISSASPLEVIKVERSTIANNNVGEQLEVNRVKPDDVAIESIPPIVQNSTEASKEHLNTLYDLLKYKFNEQMGGGLDIYNSYEDAIKNLTENNGVSRDEAVQYLNNSSNSIRWLVDPNGKGFFNSETDMLDFIKSDELQILGINLNGATAEQYLEAHKNDLIPIMDRYNSSPDLSTFIKTLAPEAIGLFVLYEMIQYGLAIPTGGLSLVLPF